MIADPMADLDGGGGTGGGNDGDKSSTGSTTTNTKDVWDPMIRQLNLTRIDRIRSIMGITSGCVAGIMGLTGWEGLVCFITLHLFVCCMIWCFKMNCTSTTNSLFVYTRQTTWTYITTSIQGTALSFTLFWTLFYGLVYLY